MPKEALKMMKKAIAMMEAMHGGGDMQSEDDKEEEYSSEPVQQIESRTSPMPKEDGSSSSLGNSGTGGEVNDFEKRKQKKSMVMAAMKRMKY